VWGTPTAHEDDAERSVRAALDLVDAVRRMGRELGAATSVKGLPHSPQNLRPGVFGDPQLGQFTASRAPHSPQNLRPGSFSTLQFEQIT
jgi:hypothetical protein